MVIQQKQKILTAEDKNTQKNNIYIMDNHHDMITHRDADILDCEIKWALGSITTNKAYGGNGSLAELFQILNMDAVKVLHSICQQTWKTQWWSQDWKRSVFIPVPKKGKCQRMYKLLHNCTHFTC